jgi:F-box interacting protein
MTLGTDDLNDDVLTEILVRLPPRSVLRSRAVCKRWRHAATSASFVAAYSLRRPLDVILYPRRRGIRQYAIDRVPLDAVDGCRRLLDHGRLLEYSASCDGLLLFSVAKESFVICNPATRQCARFPALAPTPCMWVLPSGFYLHRPSGEHRVLCFAMEIPPRQYYDSTEGVYKYKRHVHDPCPYDDDDDGERIVRCPPVHYVLSTGTAQPRRLGPFAGFRGNHAFPPCGVDVGGTLHWARHPWTGTNSPAMLTFDTVAETFRKMPMPPAAATVPDHLINLFDMRGTLAASAMGEWPYLDIWSLDDYAGERWSHHARVELPAAAKVPAYGVKYRPYYGEAVAALQGDVLVLFTVGGWVTLYDVKEKRTMRVLRRGDNGRHEPCWGLYRESLVPAAIDGLPCSPGALPFSARCPSVTSW